MEPHQSYLITVPWPPSVNAAYRVFKNRIILAKVGRDYQETAIPIIQSQLRKCLYTSLSVTYWIYPPDKRKRDLANLDKILSDCMTKAGVWHDDSQIDDFRFKRMPEVTGGAIVAEIELLSCAPEVPSSHALILQGRLKSPRPAPECKTPSTSERQDSCQGTLEAAVATPVDHQPSQPSLLQTAQEVLSQHPDLALQLGTTTVLGWQAAGSYQS